MLTLADAQKRLTTGTVVTCLAHSTVPGFLGTRWRVIVPTTDGFFCEILGDRTPGGNLLYCPYPAHDACTWFSNTWVRFTYVVDGASHAIHLQLPA